MSQDELDKIEAELERAMLKMLDEIDVMFSSTSELSFCDNGCCARVEFETPGGPLICSGTLASISGLLMKMGGASLLIDSVRIGLLIVSHAEIKQSMIEKEEKSVDSNITFH